VEISYPRRGDRARTFRAAPRATATGNTRCFSVEEGPLFYGGPLLPLIRIPEVSVYRGQEKEREEMPLFALSPSVLIRSVPRTTSPSWPFASFISYYLLYGRIAGERKPTRDRHRRLRDARSDEAYVALRQPVPDRYRVRHLAQGGTYLE